jgi:sugar (pentulose or hexulose) kinase
MVRHGALPASARRACLIHDWVASRLGDTVCCTDPSDAGSAGIFHLSAKAWSEELAAALNVPSELLCEVRESGEVIGHLPHDLAQSTGLRPGVPVCNAIGDNQASFLGSVSDPVRSVLVNIGTGGQISWVVDDVRHPPGMEVRYLPIDRLIAVGAGIGGGQTYAWLAEFYRNVVASFTDQPVTDGTLFERMNQLAAGAPVDAGGLRCRPTLSGTRQAPDLRGTLDGMDLTNMTPATLTRAVLTGIVDELLAFYRSYDSAARSTHRTVVGSGNALRRNRVLADIVAQRFGLPVQTPTHLEEAAYGAALLASVSTELLPDLTAAGQLIDYDTLT